MFLKDWTSIHLLPYRTVASVVSRGPAVLQIPEDRGATGKVGTHKTDGDDAASDSLVSNGDFDIYTTPSCQLMI